MKTTIFLTAILTFSVMLISCSDNGIQSVPESLEVDNANSVPAPRTLIWSRDVFEIRSETETFVSDEFIIRAAKFHITDAIVSFKGYTNAGSEGAEGYTATLNVSGSNGEVLFSETDPEMINQCHTMYFYADNNNLTLYLALHRRQMDPLCGGASIKLTEIEVYSLN